MVIIVTATAGYNVIGWTPTMRLAVNVDLQRTTDVIATKKETTRASGMEKGRIGLYAMTIRVSKLILIVLFSGCYGNPCYHSSTCLNQLNLNVKSFLCGKLV